MYSLHRFAVACAISTILFSICCPLTVGQQTVLIGTSHEAYDIHQESVNVSCTATPTLSNVSDAVAFIVNGTTVANSTTNYTAKFITYHSANFETVTFSTKDNVDGFKDVTCVRSAQQSPPVTIFAVNYLNLAVDPAKMTVNSTNKFTCEWKVQPVSEFTPDVYYAAVEYNATKQTENGTNILAKYVSGLTVTTGRFAATHWDVIAANVTDKFEFSAKSLNANASGSYACVLNVGKSVKQRFVSPAWKTSAGEALSHQFATIALSLLSLFVACNA